MWKLMKVLATLLLIVGSEALRVENEIARAKLPLHPHFHHLPRTRAAQLLQKAREFEEYDLEGFSFSTYFEDYSLEPGGPGVLEPLQQYLDEKYIPYILSWDNVQSWLAKVQQEGSLSIEALTDMLQSQKIPSNIDVFSVGLASLAIPIARSINEIRSNLREEISGGKQSHTQTDRKTEEDILTELPSGFATIFRAAFRLFIAKLIVSAFVSQLEKFFKHVTNWGREVPTYYHLTVLSHMFSRIRFTAFLPSISEIATDTLQGLTGIKVSRLDEKIRQLMKNPGELRIDDLISAIVELLYSEATDYLKDLFKDFNPTAILKKVARSTVDAGVQYIIGSTVIGGGVGTLVSGGTAIVTAAGGTVINAGLATGGAIISGSSALVTGVGSVALAGTGAVLTAATTAAATAVTATATATVCVANPLGMMLLVGLLI
eukprot:c6762_g1_i1.p1 GENE.c6762_g1_i1~~c6762_g1_i1.p1  ORF type:complete len:432 (+),score=119.39 c6762_g1_i1:44-1339(+)